MGRNSRSNMSYNDCPESANSFHSVARQADPINDPLSDAYSKLLSNTPTIGRRSAIPTLRRSHRRRRTFQYRSNSLRIEVGNRGQVLSTDANTFGFSASVQMERYSSSTAGNRSAFLYTRFHLLRNRR